MTWLWAAQNIAGAQSLKIGMNLGANTIHSISTAAPYERDVNGFVFGPFLELSLPRNFAIEASALRKGFRYQRQEISELFPSPGIVQETTVWDTHATSWEIPVAIKKYVTLFPNIRAFGSAGVSTRHTSGRTDITGIRAIPRPSQP